MVCHAVKSAHDELSSFPTMSSTNTLKSSGRQEVTSKPHEMRVVGWKLLAICGAAFAASNIVGVFSPMYLPMRILAGLSSAVGFLGLVVICSEKCKLINIYMALCVLVCIAMLVLLLVLYFAMSDGTKILTRMWCMPAEDAESMAGCMELTLSYMGYYVLKQAIWDVSFTSVKMWVTCRYAELLAESNNAKLALESADQTDRENRLEESRDADIFLDEELWSQIGPSNTGQNAPNLKADYVKGDTGDKDNAYDDIE
eukprot:GEMP01052908.1.p1 GENE.GEMP01052908.1~~GEMP01052908.1.p1  ORF type:complete len:256 (+),score=49.48 GEMP01052908.1:124-891(+)